MMPSQRPCVRLYVSRTHQLSLTVLPAGAGAAAGVVFVAGAVVGAGAAGFGASVGGGAAAWQALRRRAAELIPTDPKNDRRESRNEVIVEPPIEPFRCPRSGSNTRAWPSYAHVPLRRRSPPL